MKLVFIAFNVTFMIITWHGKTSFTLKNDESIIEIDSSTKDSDSVLVFTSKQENSSSIFDWPGEYEAGGVGFTGVAYKKGDDTEGIIYNFDVNHIRVCHLAYISDELSEEELEQIGSVDILLLPIGEDGTVNAKKAVKVVEQIEPRIIIPMLFSEINLTEFKKEMGIVELEAIEKLDIKRSSLPSDEMKCILLQKS